MNNINDIQFILNVNFYGEIKSKTEYSTFYIICTGVDSYEIRLTIWDKKVIKEVTFKGTKQQAQSYYDKALQHGIKRTFN